MLLLGRWLHFCHGQYTFSVKIDPEAPPRILNREGHGLVPLLLPKHTVCYIRYSLIPYCSHVWSIRELRQKPTAWKAPLPFLLSFLAVPTCHSRRLESKQALHNNRFPTFSFSLVRPYLNYEFFFFFPFWGEFRVWPPHWKESCQNTVSSKRPPPPPFLKFPFSTRASDPHIFPNRNLLYASRTRELRYGRKWREEKKINPRWEIEASKRSFCDNVSRR